MKSRLLGVSASATSAPFRGGVTSARMRVALVAADIAFPIVLLLSVWLIRDSDRYRQVVGEDGLLEWLQAAAFALTAWALISAAIRSSGRYRAALVFCGIAMVGVLGEELAWGTRLTGTSVEFVESRNLQGDSTLHNLGGGLETSFVGIVIVAGALALLVASRWDLVRDVPLTVVLWLIAPAAYAAYRLSAGSVPYTTAKMSEVVEFLFAVAVARIAWSVRNRAPQPLAPVGV